MSKDSRAYGGLPDSVADLLRKLGENFAVARKRRQMSRTELAERMMVNLKTVERMEKGDPGVGIGMFATALWVFGLQRRLDGLIAPETDASALQEDIRKLPRDFRRTTKKMERVDF